MKKQSLLINSVIIFIFVSSTVMLVAAGEPRLKNLGNGICQDTKTGLMWQVKKSKSFKDQDSAVQYTKKLSLGGYSNWRLPYVDEWKHLKKEIYDLKKNGDCELERPFSKYWAEDQENGIKSGKLATNDECGGGYNFVAKNKGYVRAVR